LGLWHTQIFLLKSVCQTLFYAHVLGDAAFQKTRLVPIDENKPLEVDVEPTDSKVTPLPADATDHESGEDVEVIDSDLEEGDNIFEYLNDYCF